MAGRILIVERDEIIRNVLCRELSLQGIVADELRAGESAVDAIRSGRYKLILLDLAEAPGVLDVIRHDAARPVIIILSSGEGDVRKLAGESAVTLSINKDFAIHNMDPVVGAIVAVCRMK